MRTAIYYHFDKIQQNFKDILCNKLYAFASFLKVMLFLQFLYITCFRKQNTSIPQKLDPTLVSAFLDEVFTADQLIVANFNMTNKARKILRENWKTNNVKPNLFYKSYKSTQKHELRNSGMDNEYNLYKDKEIEYNYKEIKQMILL